MSLRCHKIYTFKRVDGPGNFFDDHYSAYSSGVYVGKNKIHFSENKRIFEKEFYLSVMFRKILKDYYGDLSFTRNTNSLISIFSRRVMPLFLRANNKGLNFNMCGIFIEELIDELKSL